MESQVKVDTWTDLKGIDHTIARSPLYESFEDCVTLHLLTVFLLDAAEQERYYVNVHLKKPTHVLTCQFVVDISLVHHVAVRVFSCTLSEECYLYCKVMTSISPCMSQTLARLCGECCMVPFRYFVPKMMREIHLQKVSFESGKSIFLWVSL